jgi:hypothetical protein
MLSCRWVGCVQKSERRAGFRDRGVWTTFGTWLHKTTAYFLTPVRRHDLPTSDLHALWKVLPRK